MRKFATLSPEAVTPLHWSEGRLEALGKPIPQHRPRVFRLLLRKQNFTAVEHGLVRRDHRLDEHAIVAPVPEQGNVAGQRSLNRFVRCC